MQKKIGRPWRTILELSRNRPPQPQHLRPRFARNWCSGVFQQLASLELHGVRFAVRDAIQVAGKFSVRPVDCPSKRRRIVFFVLEVYIGATDQPSRQPILTKQCRPMKGGLPEESA